MSEEMIDANLLRQIKKEIRVVPNLGFLEVDTFAHSGSSDEGMFIYTINSVHNEVQTIKDGWSEFQKDHLL